MDGFSIFIPLSIYQGFIRCYFAIEVQSIHPFSMLLYPVLGHRVVANPRMYRVQSGCAYFWTMGRNQNVRSKLTLTQEGRVHSLGSVSPN